MAIPHIHLVSDSTGETLNAVIRASLAQFEGVDAMEHHWTLVRTIRQMDTVLEAIDKDPGLVVYTLVDEKLRLRLVEYCRVAGLVVMPVLDSIIAGLSDHFGQKAKNLVGRQHELDADYFDRIEAMNFALAHDDGQAARNYEEADIILIGVSRSSKTPTSIYLANRGIKVANVPIVPNCSLPPELFHTKHPLVIGLTKDAGQLVQIRKNRLQMIAQSEESDYVDPVRVREELAAARRLCAEHHWPIIDVSRRSIEETAATILQMLEKHRFGQVGFGEIKQKRP